METNTMIDQLTDAIPSFFKRPRVKTEIIPVATGIPFGVERVLNSKVGIGGAYGTWGESYDNISLMDLVSIRMGNPLPEAEKMNLSELGFISRHHVQALTKEEHLELELEVGSRLLREAAIANQWKIEDVEAVLIGISK